MTEQHDTPAPGAQTSAADKLRSLLPAEPMARRRQMQTLLRLVTTQRKNA